MTAPYSAIGQEIGEETKSDVFFYNGQIRRGDDLRVIQEIYDRKSKDRVILVLVTSGGDPNAAYKIARYIQSRYEKFTLLVSGLCKSAGTLIAVGAHEIAFSPYGELGPIDVQMYKTDNLAERQSGLTITESLDHLTASALRMHGRIFGAIMADTEAIISFRTAAQAATELVTGLYAPMFSQIDPMEVGDKARWMRVASDYGKRLNARVGNLKNGALNNLTRTYPSHSFVIDMQEANSLFNNIRPLSEKEQVLVTHLNYGARYEMETEEAGVTFFCLSQPEETEKPNELSTDRAANTAGDGQDSPAATEETKDVSNRDDDGLRADERRAPKSKGKSRND